MLFRESGALADLIEKTARGLGLNMQLICDKSAPRKNVTQHTTDIWRSMNDRNGALCIEWAIHFVDFEQAPEQVAQ